jgi:hypothetical protein
MTTSAVAHTNLPESREAGRALGLQIAASLHGIPDAVIVFISPVYHQGEVLQALKEACPADIIVGCSSAGEFTSDVQGEGLACALALSSSEMRFAAAVGRGLSKDRTGAAQELVSSFQGTSAPQYRYHSALVLTDALAGQADDLIEQLMLLTGGTYQFFGGGSGDNAQFRSTPVFYGTEVISDAVVALEILSNKPLGVGVRHGWQPASRKMRVTETEGMRLVSLNAMPAVEAFQQQAQNTGQSFDPANPLPFFLHNIIGIDTGSGYKLRVPLAVDTAGAVLCAAEIPAGATVSLMRSSTESAAEAAADATSAALKQLNGYQPEVALFFDCVATRLRMGKEFGFELAALQEALGLVHYIGCNSHGQIARSEGQFNGFHNCTAVVCLIPR